MMFVSFNPLVPISSPRRYPHVPNRLLPFCGHVRPPVEGRCIDLYRPQSSGSIQRFSTLLPGAWGRLTKYPPFSHISRRRFRSYGVSAVSTEEVRREAQQNQVGGEPAQRRAVTYVRVSTDMQAIDGLSLEAQQSAIEAYCALHGIQLVRICKDVMSGGKDQRPGLQEALDVLERSADVLDCTEVRSDLPLNRAFLRAV